jgi:autotransporter-associated beta strand protein
VNSNTLTTETAINGGNTVMTKAGPGAWTIAGSSASGAFGINIDDGVVNLNKASGNGLDFAIAAGTVTLNTNGSLVMMNPNSLQLGTAANFTMAGGTVEFNGDSGEIFQSITFDSGILQNSANAAEFTLSQGISLVGTNCDFNVTNDASLEVDAVITNTGSLYETGNGILTLTNNNAYTGSTIIEGGTLALAGSISNSALISVHSGATLNVTGRGDQTLTLNAGQTLTGKGSLNGILVASPGSIVAPGGTLTAGTFTVANNASLNGTLLINLNNTNTPNSSQIVSTSGTITYAGTLSVTNTGPALQAGQTFQLFPSAVSTFANINLPTTDASGNTYTWNDQITVNGSITVATVTPTGTINPNPGKIQFSISGSTLSLAWPTNSGWLLQTQTNSLAVGISNNWVTIPGSAAITSTNITINPGIGSVFYRMVHP